MKDNIILEAYDLVLVEDDSLAEVASDGFPINGELRSLAKVTFTLCHSLPYVNSNKSSWTYPTLLNSFSTVRHQLVNLNHQLEDNGKLLKKELDNVVIGHMVDADIVELEKDEHGHYPLIPERPIAIQVTAYLYKRVVPSLVERLKNGERLKVSMECEFTDYGFYYLNNFYTRSERPEFVGKREYDGFPVTRVLGGISPEGGIVNFWGCAVLDNQRPADENAEILTAVASAIGEPFEEAYEKHAIIEEGNTETNNATNEDEMKKFIETLPEELAALLEATWTGSVEDLTAESVAQAIVDYDKKVKELEKEVESKLTTIQSLELAYILDSEEDKLDKLKDLIRDAIKESEALDDNCDFYIAAVFENKVIVEVYEYKYDENNGYPMFCVNIYEMPMTKNGDTVTVGEPKEVNIRYVQVIEPKVNSETAQDNQGENEMPKEKEVAEVVEPKVTDEPVADVNVASELESEIASLKTRLEELVTENNTLKSKVEAFETEKEQARVQAVLASRKEVLAQDFDLEDLLDEEEESKIALMEDEAFEAYASKLKKIAAKAKKAVASEEEEVKDKTETDAEVSSDMSGGTAVIAPASPEAPAASGKNKFSNF